MAEIASAFVTIIPSAKGFGASLSKQAGAETTGSGRLLGGMLGKSMLVGFAAVGVAAGVGKALFGIGQTFDDMSDTIAVGTGASGKALEALNKVAEDVGRSTPSSFGDIGTAVAGLSQRLGLTGGPLEEMATRVLNLSRITKTDLGANIEDLTRVFGDWGIKMSDQPKALDEILAASQMTGAGINDLAQSVVRMGAPLRQFGFSFEEGLALFGKWEKEGVNAQTVMAGLKIGLGQFSKAGLDPQKALANTTAAIKAAGSAGKANEIAIKAFGQRAGPDMAAAVREGRFEIGNLIKGIKGSRGALDEADKGTRDFAETWRVFKNNVLLKLKPAADLAFSAFTDFAIAVLPKVLSAFSSIGAVVAPFIARLGRLGAALLPVAKTLISALWPIVKKVFEFLSTHTKVLAVIAGAFLFLVAPFTAVAIGLALLYTKSKTVRDIFAAVASFVTGTLIPAISAMADFFITKIVPVIVDVAQSVAKSLKPVFEQIATTITTKVVPGVQKLIGKFQEARPTIAKVVEVVAKVIGFFIKMYAAVLGKVLPILIRLIAFLVGKFFTGLGTMITQIAAGVRSFIDFGKKIVAAAKFAVEFARIVIARVGNVIEKVKALPGKIKGFFEKLPEEMKTIGGNIVDGLKRGITAAWHFVTDEVERLINKIPKKIRGLLGISSPSKVTYLLGLAVGEGFAKGVAATTDKVGAATEKLGKKVKEKVAKIRDQLATVRSDFAGLVDPIASAFTGNLFDSETAGGFVTSLLGTKGQLSGLLAAFKTLIGQGLKPGFLYQLFQSGNAGLILDMAANPALAVQAGNLFGDVTSLSSQLGTAVADATDKGAALENQTVRLEKKLNKLIKHVDESADRTGDRVNGAAANGHRRGHR